jgi:hypothetical protein
MVDVLDHDVESLVLTAAEQPEVIVQLRALGGAISDVHADATAFAHRHQSALIIGTAFSPRGRATLTQAWTPLEPLFSGAYANFDSRPTPTSMELAFPSALRQRLRTVKNAYDPSGRLRPLPE